MTMRTARPFPGAGAAGAAAGLGAEFVPAGGAGEGRETAAFPAGAREIPAGPETPDGAAAGSVDGTTGGAELGGRIGLGSTSASAEVERARASPC